MRDFYDRAHKSAASAFTSPTSLCKDIDPNHPPKSDGKIKQGHRSQPAPPPKSDGKIIQI
jgi:hypothetical protein